MSVQKLTKMFLLTILALSVGNPTCPCDPEYTSFTEEYSRTYTREGCKNFCYNLNKINSHNKNPTSTYQAEIKWFHDLKPPHHSTGYYPNFRDKSTDTFATKNDFPIKTIQHVNWFEQGRVTDIRNQGNCGDCWAESAVGVLESLYQQQYGHLTQLSVQQAAECSPQEYGAGCEGGWPINVLQYVQNVTGGLCSEKNYPTTIGNGQDVNCNSTMAKNCNEKVKIGRVLSIPTGDEIMLENAVLGDVVSVGIDATGQGFGAYADGIYNGMFDGAPDCSQTSLDHAVVIIGMGTRLSDNVPYYLVRNSWGVQGWGKMNGYILFYRGNNTCGIAQDAICVRE